MIRAVIFDCFGVVLDATTNEKLPTVLEAIKRLKHTHKIGMLSNVFTKASITRHFADGEIEQYFDVIVASGEVGMEKPQAEIYELAAMELGVAPSECLFVDDIRRFCDGAEAVGMRSLEFIDPRISLPALHETLGVSYAHQD